MTTSNDYRLIPSFSASFGTGWKVMSDNFLRLFLVIIILGFIATPMSFLHVNYDFHDIGDFENFPFDHERIFKVGAIGLAAAMLGFARLLYVLLLMPIFTYGGKMMFVKSVRKQVPEFDLLINGFRKNYLNIVLSNLLVFALIGIGFVCLLIPGIIIACRLAFTPYLVMDKGLDPIKAAEESWRLTRGHGWTIFFMGFISFFIFIGGLICLFFGVFIAIIWIKGAFASLYHSVLIEKGQYEVEAV